MGKEMGMKVLASKHAILFGKSFCCSIEIHHLLTIFHGEEVGNKNEPQTLFHVPVEHDIIYYIEASVVPGPKKSKAIHVFVIFVIYIT